MSTLLKLAYNIIAVEAQGNFPEDFYSQAQDPILCVNCKKDLSINSSEDDIMILRFCKHVFHRKCAGDYTNCSVCQSETGSPPNRVKIHVSPKCWKKTHG